MYIRKLLDDEYDEVIELIYEAVHAVCKDDYTEKELDAWAPKMFDARKFREALSGCFNLVMIDKNKIAGFISVEQNGYINRLYTHKDFQRRGIASRLLEKAESHAADSGISTLTLDSSKTAEGFYLKMGFEKSGVSVTERNGAVFRSAMMEKKVQQW